MKVRFTIPPDLRYYNEYAITVPPEMEMDAIPQKGDVVVILVEPGHPERVGLRVKRIYWELTDPENPFVMVDLGDIAR